MAAPPPGHPGILLGHQCISDRGGFSLMEKLGPKLLHDRVQFMRPGHEIGVRDEIVDALDIARTAVRAQQAGTQGQRPG